MLAKRLASSKIEGVGVFDENKLEKSHRKYAGLQKTYFGYSVLGLRK